VLDVDILVFVQASSHAHPATMEGAFTHLGNHLISDSAAAINAGADDLSSIDPDESLLYGQYGGRGGLGPSRRRNDDDDNETEVFDDDDNESLASMPVDGMKTLGLRGTEDEKDLPSHACA
jgi:regulator of nonsense transcripts 1